MGQGRLGSILPTRSIILFALCGAAFLVFLLLIILPGQRLQAQLDQDISGLKARIEEQKILSPVFKNLFSKTKGRATQDLPVPERAKLKRTEIPAVPKRLQEIAAVHRLKVREVIPDVNTLTDTSGRFRVQVVAAGQFTELRGFLIDVGALSYFYSFEEIEIRAVEGGEEFALKIWMARE
jgi:Tfp pilus assembly protein PilO